MTTNDTLLVNLVYFLYVVTFILSNYQSTIFEIKFVDNDNQFLQIVKTIT